MPDEIDYEQWAWVRSHIDESNSSEDGDSAVIQKVHKFSLSSRAVQGMSYISTHPKQKTDKF
jgi:hypothetical protein